MEYRKGRYLRCRRREIVQEWADIVGQRVGDKGRRRSTLVEVAANRAVVGMIGRRCEAELIEVFAPHHVILN